MIRRTVQGGETSPMTRRPGVGRLPRNRENWVATSSASPQGMAGFLAAVSGELSALAPEINATAADTNAFMSAPCDGQFRGARRG